MILAFGVAFIASRALQSQVSGFLQAARRLGGGDFSSPVPTQRQAISDDLTGLTTHGHFQELLSAPARSR